MLSYLKDNWQAIKEKVRDEYDISSLLFDTWIVPMEIYDLKNNELRIMFTGESSDWAINYIEKKFSLQFQLTIEELTKQTLSIKFIPEIKAGDTGVFQRPDNSQNTPVYHVSNIDPKFTFDNFVVGANNQMAHAASISVAENPGREYNPLFIYGGSGLGKTHLMHAIANFIYKNRPNAKVLYVTSEVFMNEVIEAMRNRNSDSMSYIKNKYRSVDILLIDDIQMIIGRAEQTLVEFFNTFNHLYENGKQIVLSSDKPPREFSQLEDRLLSRFERGLIVDIALPDYETRMAILRKKADNDGYIIDNEILHYIATNIKSNIRSMEGALSKISSYSKLNPGTKITLELAKQNLKDYIDPENEKKLTPENIINVVADYYGIRPEDIRSSKSTKEISLPRQIAIYLIRIMTDDTLIEVGNILGNRHYSTVKYGFECITEKMKESDELKTTIEILKKKILA